MPAVPGIGLLAHRHGRGERFERKKYLLNIKSYLLFQAIPSAFKIGNYF